MILLLPQDVQKLASVSCLCLAGLLPSATFAASVVWNPLEDRYDAQLAKTVMIGPKGCVFENVAKELADDRVEASFRCQYPDDPDQFAGLFPAGGGLQIPTVGGGGNGAGGGGVIPVGSVSVLSPTGGTATTGGTTPIVGLTPTTSVAPTDGGGETAVDPVIPPAVVGGTETEEPDFDTVTEAPTGVVPITSVPLPAPFAALFLGLAFLLGLGKKRRAKQHA